jgi:hypothetical protein
MKLKIYFTALLLMSVAMQSCEDSLDEVPYSSLNKDQVFADEEGLKKATLGVYQSYTAPDYSDVVNRFVLSESGHRYATAGIFGPGSDPYYRFGHLPKDGAFNSIWGRFYKTIFRANSVIGNASKAVQDPKVANMYIAEARFLRAYAYFNLVRYFGGVPLIDEEIISLEQSDLIYAPASGIAETYDFIVEDMLFAEANLPDNYSGADIGRISSGTAKAMLGKVYLHMAGKPLAQTEYFQKAADKLKEVVGSTNESKYNFGLLENFEDVFSATNERNREVVLSFGYYANASNPQGNFFPFFLFPQGFQNGDEQTTYGLTYAFYKLFGKGDTRRDFTIIDRYRYKGSPNFAAEAGDSIVYDSRIRVYVNKKTGVFIGDTTTGYGMAYGKIARVPRIDGSPAQGYNADLIELRFADVILCLAEALMESGKSSEALPLLNRVRTRAKATPSKASNLTELRTAIRTERRLELSGEFTTVFDIRRWGTLKEEMAEITVDQIVGAKLTPYDPRFEIYPIPQAQLDVNPNLKQNQGW